MDKQEKLDYLAEAIEELIDAKIRLSKMAFESDHYIVEDKRANLKESLAILLNIEYH